MLQITRRSFATAFLLTVSIGTIFSEFESQPAMAGCNPFGCSQSSAAECNPFGCPNPPLGKQCSAFGCPSSPQLPKSNPPAANPANPTVILAPNQQPAGGSADAIVSCIQRLLYKPAKVCTASTPYGHCYQYGDGLVRTEISEATAAQACQNAH